MKQTAVEFLVKELNEKAIVGGTIDRFVMNNAINQAKEIENQEKMEAFIEGYKQRAEASNLIFDEYSRIYAVDLFEQLKKEPTQECKGSFKDCFKPLNECVCDTMKNKETLGKAAEKWCSQEGFYPDPRQSFVAVAKWPQEKSYSEEEVGELVYNIIGKYGKHYGIMIDGAKLNEWFEQFKKK